MLMIVARAYKYRLYPKPAQAAFLAQHFGATRFVYNYFLEMRKNAYDADVKLSGFDCKKMLPGLKVTYPWLKEINSQSLQEAVINLEKAYKRFFRKLGDYPTFKKKRSRQSFTALQHCRMLHNLLYIPKLKTGLRMKLHRKLEGTIKSCTISRNLSGKYFVSFSVEEHIMPRIAKISDNSIDLGLTQFATFADGSKIAPARHLRKSLKKLKRLQRRLSRKVKGSSNRRKARRKVARLHEYVKNQRQNFLHQLSRKVVNENQVIYLEDLNVKGMMQFRNLGLSVADAGMGEFVRQLKYKAEWSGKKVIQINRFYPSSKRCSVCGKVNKNLSLKDRTWVCDSCGTVHDRDHNAAKNILTVGRDSPDIKPVKKRTSVFSMSIARMKGKPSSMKQEAKASV